MGASRKAIGILTAAVTGTAVIAASGQSPPVLTGAAAYGDWRSDAPGQRRKITPADMPPPYETASASRGPTVVARPGNAWPKAPPGFAVELFAGGLDNPRLIRVSPSGDVFVAESEPGRLRVSPCRGRRRPSPLPTISISRSGSPFGRRVRTRATFMSPAPTGWSAFRIGREPCSRPARRRPSSPSCRAGGHWTRDVVFSAGRRPHVRLGRLAQQRRRPHDQRAVAIG